MKTLFITGTDTGVGKTVLTVLLVRFLRSRGINAAALKPVCSGGREDARKLFAAMDGSLSLDEINPWHFRVPIAPMLAARLESKKVKLSAVARFARATQKRRDILLVEGAGGLLSPLGENFNSRDLILSLRAAPIVVAQNKLGVINQMLLTLEALPKIYQTRTRIVLMSAQKADASTRSNPGLLAKYFPAQRIFSLPWFGKNFEPAGLLKNSRVRQTLQALTQ